MTTQDLFFKTYSVEMMISMGFIKERVDHHPESSLLQHILLTVDRSKNYGKTMIAIAMFHDIGKYYTYKQYGNSYDHAKTSAWICKENHDLIVSFGADFDTVLYVVKNHSDFYTNPKKYTDVKYSQYMKDFSLIDDMTYDFYSNDDLQQYIGKHVFVTKNDGSVTSGICDSIGANPLIKVRLQIVIDRSPIRISYQSQVCTFIDIRKNLKNLKIHAK